MAAWTLSTTRSFRTPEPTGRGSVGGRPTWIIADVHGGESQESDRQLVALLRRAAIERVDLLFLGDLFVAWLGPPRFWSQQQRLIMSAIDAVRHAGSIVGFVVGNRDYLVKESLEGRSFDWVVEGETVVSLGSVPTLLAHGDCLNPKDRAYLRWRRLSRSRVVTKGLLRLPSRVGPWLASKVEERMRRSNLRMKEGPLPIEALHAVALRASTQGAERVLVGHFHVDRVIEFPDAPSVIIAPAWCEERRFLRLLPSGRLESTSSASEPALEDA